MPSKDHRKISTAFGLIPSLLCMFLMRPALAFDYSHRAPRAEDHSPAYKEGVEALRGANYEKASELFKQAAADKPDDMWAFYNLGLCLLNLKRFDEAAKAYQQAMVIKPNEAAVHYQLGKAYLGIGN